MKLPQNRLKSLEVKSGFIFKTKEWEHHHVSYYQYWLYFCSQYVKEPYKLITQLFLLFFICLGFHRNLYRRHLKVKNFMLLLHPKIYPFGLFFPLLFNNPNVCLIFFIHWLWNLSNSNLPKIWMELNQPTERLKTKFKSSVLKILDRTWSSNTKSHRDRYPTGYQGQNSEDAMTTPCSADWPGKNDL